MKAAGGSRTAVLVCQGRAAADGLVAPGRFADPVAAALLRDDERRPVEQVRATQPPSSWLERIEYESVRACAAIAVPRTVAIDDAVRQHAAGQHAAGAGQGTAPRLGAPQLVILGAGLDTRAWRLPELADRDVYEVDHPASQRDKRDRVAGLPEPARPVRFVPVDLARDRLDAALAAAGHRRDLPTTWIWEGVVPYLTRAEVERTTAAVAGMSAPGSRLIVNYQARVAAIAAGQLLSRAAYLVAGRRSMWANEPWRSLWTATAMGNLLRRHGFTVSSDDDLVAVAARLSTSTARRASLRSGRVAVADRPG